jgi:hypothetical protein
MNNTDRLGLLVVCIVRIVSTRIVTFDRPLLTGYCLPPLTRSDVGSVVVYLGMFCVVIVAMLWVLCFGKTNICSPVSGVTTVTDGSVGASESRNPPLVQNTTNLTMAI